MPINFDLRLGKYMYFICLPSITCGKIIVFISCDTHFLVLVQEGLYLVKNGVSPYSGDVVHEVRIPLEKLKIFERLMKARMRILQ